MKERIYTAPVAICVGVGGGLVLGGVLRALFPLYGGQ